MVIFFCAPSDISTHALTEGDFKTIKRWSIDYHFNSRPHGGRPIFSDNLAFTSSFQLTPSRRATINLPPLALRSLISTHALTEGDLCSEIRKAETISFQLTPSRRATSSSVASLTALEISTHALTEGDTNHGKEKMKRIFQLTPSQRATMICFRSGPSPSYFNSRPHGGRRHNTADTQICLHISTHALTEGDIVDTLCDTSTIFQLTPSRRATISHCCNPFLCLISTHALTEGDNSPPYRFRFTFISTHALTEGDAVFIFDRRTLFISTHALTEGDTLVETSLTTMQTFQLTPSRRATSTNYNSVFECQISTHALTEGDEGTNDIFFLLSISTHALTEGDDLCIRQHLNFSISTHALTEGDKTDILEFFVCIISTHALTEGDWLSRSYCRRLQYFNSRPHGGRPRVTNGELYFETFQLTPSRRATLVGKVLLVSLAISTHALTEGDLSEQRCLYCICHFNSRPHGGRHVLQILVEIRGVFQLTPSRRATIHR